MAPAAPLGFALLAASCNAPSTGSCHAGAEGCVCLPGDRCDDDLSCISDTCVDLGDNPGTGGSETGSGGNSGSGGDSTASSASGGGNSTGSGGTNSTGGATASGGAMSSASGGSGGSSSGSGGTGGEASGGVGGGTGQCEAGEARACYTGDPETERLGTCQAGMQACDEFGAWGDCEDEVLPTTEACDGVDNDCDGELDEGCVCSEGATQACYSGPTGTLGIGLCEEGSQSCDANAWGDCEDEVTPHAELCDGLDNDCDGSEDEGNPEGGAACSTGLLGVCAAGTVTCQDGDLDCVQNVTASTEVCNQLDDDCDGTADEGNPGGGSACSTGLFGVCAAGTLTCQSGSLNCVQNVAASTESCNGVDDDCDNTVDEGCVCEHDICVTGGALTDSCNACVSEICDIDSFCCNTAWDSACVGYVSSVCGDDSCMASVCTHSPCVTGAPLTPGCDSEGCVNAVCTTDSYCCTTNWDSVCVNEAESLCASCG